MSESSSPAACPDDDRATDMDAEAEAEAQADAESERLVRDIVLCQARVIGSSDKKRSRSRKPKPKSRAARPASFTGDTDLVDAEEHLNEAMVAQLDDIDAAHYRRHEERVENDGEHVDSAILLLAHI